MSYQIPNRGPFPFGLPYNTLGIRVSNETDGEILPRTYSYWQNINAHRFDSYLLVLGGIKDKGPCLWKMDKATHDVTFEGPLFAEGHVLRNSTAEGWYFDFYDPTILYCTDDEHLYRYDVFHKTLDTVVDITPFRWMGHKPDEKCFALRQWHSSRDGSKHSASVLKVVDDGPWPLIGTIVYDERARQPWQWFPVTPGKKLDESQIDDSGLWLLIKEDDDNRVINLETGDERLIRDKDGAAGHSDNGWGYMAGADNQQKLATWRLWDLATLTNKIVYESPWDLQVLHVAYCKDWMLGSGQLRDLVRIPLDGTCVATPIAPRLTEVCDNYDLYPKASLDPYGDYAFWTAFLNGRYDIFLVKI